MKNSIHSSVIIMVLLAIGTPLFGQEKSLVKNLSYTLEASTSYSNNQTPLWLNSNKYGISSTKAEYRYLRGEVKKPLTNFSSTKWKLGYGLDVSLCSGMSSKLFIQQLYGELQYSNWLRLTVGSIERPMNLKNQELSSGSQTLGINSHPLPEVRIEVPDYLSLTGKSNWIGFKGHVAYGKRSDDNWQKDFVNGTRRTEGSLIHTKSGFIRLGNEEKFPLVIEGGLEMACEFGGTSYDLNYPGITQLPMEKGFKDFFDAFLGLGSDATDKKYKNAAGNTLGSYLASISYKFNTWKIRAYYDHYFEDHSQLFYEYGWLDGLLGLDITLPKNRFITSFVYEYMHTRTQSGPIYHDHTNNVPDQISAVDKYYNHTIFTGWQNWGQSIGNPIYLSPIYNDDHTLFFKSTRFIAHHFGISGDPIPSLHYRMLFTYSEHWGTYDAPFTDKQYNFSYLGEVTYVPHNTRFKFLKGSSIKLSIGIDNGDLMGNNTGAQLKFTKKGLLNF